MIGVTVIITFVYLSFQKIAVDDTNSAAVSATVSQSGRRNSKPAVPPIRPSHHLPHNGHMTSEGRVTSSSNAIGCLTPGNKRSHRPHFVASPEPSPEGGYVGQHSQGIGGHYAESYLTKRRRKLWTTSQQATVNDAFLCEVCKRVETWIMWRLLWRLDS